MNLDPQLQTDKITPELIDYVVAKIVREIQPEKIILYGSYARGDYHEHSDLDLFIIKDGKVLYNKPSTVILEGSF